jgi:hypothetical protein
MPCEESIHRQETEDTYFTSQVTYVKRKHEKNNHITNPTLLKGPTYIENKGLVKKPWKKSQK